jgi:hypothetical protein
MGKAAFKPILCGFSTKVVHSEAVATSSVRLTMIVDLFVAVAREF